eukprot:6175434-Pleurochrysis_carterae.AAC.1
MLLIGLLKAMRSVRTRARHHRASQAFNNEMENDRIQAFLLFVDARSTKLWKANFRNAVLYGAIFRDSASIAFISPFVCEPNFCGCFLVCEPNRRVLASLYCNGPNFFETPGKAKASAGLTLEECIFSGTDANEDWFMRVSDRTMLA